MVTAQFKSLFYTLSGVHYVINQFRFKVARNSFLARADWALIPRAVVLKPTNPLEGKNK